MLYGISAVFEPTPFSNDAVLNALSVASARPPRELRTDRRVRADLAKASLFKPLICPAAFSPNGLSMARAEPRLRSRRAKKPARRLHLPILLFLKSRQARRFALKEGISP